MTIRCATMVVAQVGDYISRSACVLRKSWTSQVAERVPTGGFRLIDENRNIKPGYAALTCKALPRQRRFVQTSQSKNVL